MGVTEKWGLVIPAGGLVKDPLATALGTPRKALAMIGGKTCVERTLHAAREAGFERIAVVSGEDVREVIGDDCFIEERGGQIANAAAGVEALAECEWILFMPADTPFLHAEAINHFVQSVEAKLGDAGANWFAAGLCPYSAFLEVLPGFEHPHIKLTDGDYMSGAFYATSREGFLNCAKKFEGFSHNRKSQFRMLMQIGIVPMVKYLFHRMSLAEGEAVLGRFFEGSAIVVTDCDPWSMADIDTVDEYQRLVNEADPGKKV
ncbi:hypothetical protein CCB80_13335 [Armatimonadetes bacterium Uphvl-Ar1]|nr:hypothetical protein CCB80_13335 [Armatimonadetes bacterium Uphvl-Ar1]